MLQWEGNLFMLPRRLLIAAFLLVAIASSSKAHWERLESNYFVAGVPTNQFQYFEARQRKANWCWAATVQMVLNFHGLYVSQEQVVDRIFRQQVNEGATPDQILEALHGWAPDYRGRFSAITSTPYIFSDADLVNDLTDCWPLIVGLKNGDESGHTYVLTAVYYRLDRNRRPILDKVILRDPWPSNKSKQEWSWDKVQPNLTFAARIRVFRY